jgi:phosphatidylglycerol:prolipoprotein diacylglycerol transferase
VNPLIQWWQNLPSKIDPVIFSFGQIHIRWYGLMYIVVFALVYSLVMYRIRTEKYPYSHECISDFFFWLVLSVLVGGRLGYVLFYDLAYYLHHPLEIISPVRLTDAGLEFTGIYGMSYHGGLIAVIFTFYVYSKKHAIDFFRFVDLFAPAVPLGYTFGRLGNFLNGELFGRATTQPWGMYFPLDQSGNLRHPSQLYEAFFEGIVLFLILWFLRKRKTVDGFLLGSYLIGYGIVRFVIEFYREPDAHLGFVIGPFAMGQVLCFFMIITGITIIVVRSHAAAPKDLRKG